MSTRTRKPIVLALLLAAGAAVAVPGGETLLDTLWQRPATARDTVIVPDRFLRAWDPITVFFEDDEAKAAGPADDADKHARIEPEWPGAWTWLDRRTLQFKPAEPWPPLRRFTVTADGETARVSTLMTPPMSTAPRDGADGLEPVETITLTFPDPVPIDALARMVTIELRALPGLGDGPVQRLGAGDFTVKALQRPSADAAAEYTLTLRRPIPAGIKVTLRFALSLDDGTEAVSTVDFSTARPFRVEQIGCRGEHLPVGPEGATWSREQPLRCGGDRSIYVDFTAELAEWGPIEGRTLVRFEPAVEDVEFEAVGRRLQIRGDFSRETAYRVTVAPAPVKDRRGRPLELRGEASAWLYFPRQSPYLKWAAAEGIAEARGPMRVPLAGRGHGRADLRIHRVDPFDRSFWPFADRAIGVDESRRPPGPGEMPAPWTEHDPIPVGELQARLAALGTPGVSTLVDLPLRAEGDAASFGLDLAPHLARIAGPDAPGHYLVGLRPLDGSTQRSWMRLQVTDLSLTTVEAAEETWFVVTALSSGQPVDKATVKVEAVETRGADKAWRTLFEGRTDRKGMVAWKAPGAEAGTSRAIRRISVQAGRDVLVLDPDEAPERFHDDHWRSDYRDWLQWTVEALTGRSEAPRRMCHLFSERPMYRPEHDVHLKGWLRTRYRGELKPVEGVAGRIEIRGPGGAAWRLPVTTSATGGFYARWVEEAPPTGVYEAVFHDETDAELCRAAFEVEAYRLPTFAVDLVADEVVPLDRPFATKLVASWYAGGQVVERPVSWRVTQFPYTWTPKPLPGFVYSSDGRYSRTDRFESRPAIVAEDLTDNRGGATLELDPSTEPTAAPRTYVVEATVTGDDDQTVTATKRVHAVPAFALGVKLPRYLPTADVIAPEIIVAGPDGALVEGVEVTLTLKRRAWHAHLQASDFSRGEARYVTDVVDEVVTTTTVQSGKQPITAKLPIDRAGVWLVELEARDRLGRAQVVTVDLYAGGAGSVSWDKPKAGVFALSTDRAEHAPGQTATVVLQSPYQSAEALVIIETPAGNRYRWLPVRGGKASFGVEIDPTWAPKLPVHVVLMRGRVDAAKPGQETAQDLGKPTTAAATIWLPVTPLGNQIQVSLEHPATAMPGQTIPLTVKLQDPSGKPRAGEVTLWLVDKAVLALAAEARLDPLPDYLTDPETRVDVHDTRNLGFGRIPFAEMPGGGDGDEVEDELDRITVRKNFEPVPYYEAALTVPASGKLTVQVALPDNLTVFAVRAKAAAGPDRFGAGKSEIAVRLPLLVQPALPRFVRIGDRFTAGAVGRVVEGEGGPGRARLSAEGLDLTADAEQAVAWEPLRAERLGWTVTAPMPPLGPDGEPARREVTVQVAANRQSDGAGDAFAVTLPLRDDRVPVVRRRIIDLVPGQPVTLDAPDEPARPGSARRVLVLSTRPALVKMAGALDSLRRQPDGNSEQRISRARALIGTAALRALLIPGDADALAERAVADTLAWIPLVTDDRGLIAQWPGAPGRVWLTAAAAHFVADAAEAGYAVDGKLAPALAAALTRALPSDFTGFLAGESWYERVAALDGLAHLDRLDAPAFAELARNAQYLGYDGLASVVLAGSRDADAVDRALYDRLVETLAGGVTVRLYQGEEVYSGLRARGESRNALVLASETRTLAQMTRALVAAPYQGDRLPLMVDALVRLGHGDGWGSTAADAPALLALAAWLQKPAAGPQATVEIGGPAPKSVAIGGQTTVAREIQPDAPPITLTLAPGGADEAVALEMVRYLPQAPAGEAAAVAAGFVVTREWQRPIADGPPTKTPISGPGQTLEVNVGDVIEEHIQIINPDERHYVAITAPLAAGLEPMNPRLATAPPEAAPTGQLTTTPSYVQYLDDRVVWHYETLPKGTHDFYYRVRATVDGAFGQPPATAEMSYDRAVNGRSPGATVVVKAVAP